jgi:hypothetical protein
VGQIKTSTDAGYFRVQANVMEAAVTMSTMNPLARAIRGNRPQLISL